MVMGIVKISEAVQVGGQLAGTEPVWGAHRGRGGGGGDHIRRAGAMQRTVGHADNSGGIKNKAFWKKGGPWI